MEYQILSKSDLNQLMPLWKLLMAEHTELEPKLYKLSSDSEDKQAFFFLKSINSNEKFLLGCFDDKKLVGYSFGWIEERPPVLEVSKIGCLSDIIVLPEYRGRGIGRKMIKLFFEWCKKQGVKNVQLQVLEKKEAINFYTRLGFTDFMKKMLIELK